MKMVASSTTFPNSSNILDFCVFSTILAARRSFDVVSSLFVLLVLAEQTTITALLSRNF